MSTQHVGQPHDTPAEATRAILVLRWGFRISATLLVVGVLIAIARQESLDGALTPLRDLVDELGEGRARAIISLGVLLMVLTPLASTVTITATFLFNRATRYGILGGVIVAILAISVALSLW